MNQILYEDTVKAPTDIKKIVKFFAIAIIIFAIALIAVGVVSIMSKNAGRRISTVPPVISVEVEDTNLKLIITHDSQIDKVVYRWNNDEEKTILGQNREKIEYLIEIPVGINNFTMQVTDVNGLSSSFNGTYTNNGGVDIQKPTIELNKSEEERTIYIRAEDETEISYVTYRWNDEEDNKIEVADTTSNTIIEANIPVPEEAGEHVLKITAVDSNGNQEEVSRTIKILSRANKPTIETPIQYGNNLTVTVKDEEGLERIEYKINNEKYVWKKNPEYEDLKEFVYTLTLPEGESKVTITVYNKAGLVEKYVCRCKYEP